MVTQMKRFAKGWAAEGFCAQFEALEVRQLLAANFAWVTSKGTLEVIGTSKANAITVDHLGTKIVARLDRQSMTFNASGIKRFCLNGVGGNDSILLGLAKPSTLIGGSGDDTLVGGGGADSIEGDGGDDRLVPSPGLDLFTPGSGAATIDYSSQDELNLLVFPGRFQSTPEDIITVPGAPKLTLQLTAGNDRVGGISAANLVIRGGAGDDDIYVYSYDSNPTVYGGDGNDTLTADDDDYSAILYGDNGNDLFIMSHEAIPADVKDGGTGNDTEDYSSRMEDLDAIALSPGVEQLIRP